MPQCPDPSPQFPWRDSARLSSFFVAWHRSRAMALWRVGPAGSLAQVSLSSPFPLFLQGAALIPLWAAGTETTLQPWWSTKEGSEPTIQAEAISHLEALEKKPPERDLPGKGPWLPLVPITKFPGYTREFKGWSCAVTYQPSPAEAVKHSTQWHLCSRASQVRYVNIILFIVLSEKIFHFTSFYYTISITRTCLKAHFSRKMHYILAFKSANSHLLVLIIDWESCSFYFILALWIIFFSSSKIKYFKKKLSLSSISLS